MGMGVWILAAVMGGAIMGGTVESAIMEGTVMGGAMEGTMGAGETGWIIPRFFARIAVTCAVFYPLFLCGMMGAGDIKLMGMCVGFLGISDGSYMLFLSFIPAAAVSAWKLCRAVKLWERMAELTVFAGRVRREKRFLKYRIRRGKEDVIPLGPCLLLGYCLYIGIF